MASGDPEKLRNYWKPDGKINRESEVRLKEWIQANRLDVDDITSFLYMDVFVDARAKAVRELNV